MADTDAAVGTTVAPRTPMGAASAMAKESDMLFADIPSLTVVRLNSRPCDRLILRQSWTVP